MSATSQTAQVRPAAIASVPRRLAIALLALVAATAGVVTAASVLTFSGPASVNAPGLAPGSRDDHFRDARATTVSGRVGDRWYLDPAPSSNERIRDRWYSE